MLNATIPGLSAGKRYKWRARTLYAPYTVTQTGITAPPNPAHGPWRRLFGGAEAADILMDDVTPPSDMAAPADQGAYAEGSVTFNWSQASDPDSGVANYELQVGTAPGNSDVFNSSVGNVLTYDVTGSNGQTLYARVRAVNPHGLASNWSPDSDGITIDATAPSAPGIPTDAGAYASASASFTWAAATDAGSGIASYNLQVGTTPGGSDVFNNSVGSVLTYDVTGSHGQTLYARVQAINGAGIAGNWSGDSDGVMIDSTPPTAPGTPVDAGPYSLSTAVTFTWTGSTDSESGIAYYTIQVGTVPTGDDVYSGSTGTALSYTMTGLNGQTLCAMVRAVNGAGAGTWSGGFNCITIDMTAPSLFPSASSVDATHVNISFTEYVSGATSTQSYSVDNGLMISNSELQESGTTYRLTTSRQEPGVQYTITLNAANIADPAGNPLNPAANTATFVRTAAGNNAPTVPTLNSPPASSETTTQTPALAVNASTDADSDTVSYVFEIDTTSSFDSGNWQTSGVISSPTWTAAALADNMTWYWRVLATDTLSNSSWMATASLFVNTANDAPSDPGISSPADNTFVSSLTPTLSVTNAADADNDILTYEFEVYLNSNFTGTVASATGISQGGGGTTSWIVNSTLTEDTTHYWRARARDEHGLAGNYVLGAFRVNTLNSAPGAPTVGSPASGGEVTGVSPALTVTNAADADGDVVSYLFELDTVNTFDSGNKQTSGLLAEGSVETSWTPAALTDNTAWYWRVKANDGLADGPWMTTASFFVNAANDAPSVPTLNNPADNGQVTVLAPALQVNASIDPDNDALTYDFQVYSDSGLASLVTSTTGAGTGWAVSPALSDNTSYWWRARAKDEHGTMSDWMAASAFFVNNNGTNDPPAIAITKPGASEPVVYGNSFTIAWTASDPDSIAMITLGYDAVGTGCSGTQIATGLSENDGADDYTWDITNLAQGTYQVYAIITDNASTICAYGAGPIVRSDSTGDLDDDGDVDTADALKSLRIAAGIDTATSGDLRKGDVAPLVNGKPQPDDRIDIGDVVVILRKAVGLVSW